MTRIINICGTDNANFSYTNAQAMRSVGLDAEAFSLSTHPYGYKHCSTRVSREVMREQIAAADIIQVMHSDLKMVPLLQGCGKQVIVYHAGTVYRQAPDYYNSIWNPIVVKSVIALGEFAGKGSINEIYMVGAIDTRDIEPVYTCAYKWRKIRHHPSNAGTKGTAKICEMIQALPKHQLAKTQFIYSDNGSRVSPEMQLVRTADCDIYIELFKLKQKEADYGSFGISALEAAALGKVVVTNMLWKDVYNEAYGDCLLQIANTEQEFIETVGSLIDMSDQDLLQLQRQTRQWMEHKHSLEATGHRIKNLILEL